MTVEHTVQSFDYFSWVVVPLLICLARIIDVSLGTLRIIFLSKGYKRMAPIFGFFEILIWLLAIREVMVNLHNPLSYIAYALGFALGNYVGIAIEEKLSLGHVLFRVIYKGDGNGFLEFMEKHNFGFTVFSGQGIQSRVKLLFSVLNRRDIKRVFLAIKKSLPDAFYTVENIKEVKQGIFPQASYSAFPSLFRKQRKSK